MHQKTKITFDSEAYSLDHSDVRAALDNGSIPDAETHFRKHGVAEGRRPPPSDSPIKFFIEEVAQTIHGHILIVGWISDQYAHPDNITAEIGYHRLQIPLQKSIRFRRPDVEQHINGRSHDYPYGFAILETLSEPMAPVSSARVGVEGQSLTASQSVPLTLMSSEEVLQRFLTTIGHRYIGPTDLARLHLQFGGHPSLRQTSMGLWGATLDRNRALHIERFGHASPRPTISIITVLYGRTDPLPLQSALLHSLRGNADVELIIANNSPDTSEDFLREVELAYSLYRIPMTAISFRGNTGFGYANGAAISQSSSPLTLIINPDVFPLRTDWSLPIIRESLSIDNGILGAVLYYGDGSVMHDGMEIVEDRLPPQDYPSSCSRMLRVNHFAKGAPRGSIPSSPYRTVDAVSGAFMLMKRDTFETLGGFSNSYIYGHYEDADLCLRAKRSGIPVRVARDLRYVHLEGSGSRWESYHRGASLLNRLIFNDTWSDRLSDTASTASEGLV